MSFSDINIQELASAFMVLFAVIDITGAVPIINDIQNKGHTISAIKAALASYILLVAFLFVGDGLLNLFSVDISSFAVAGSLVIFVLAVEMIFGIPIFKNDGPSGTASHRTVSISLDRGSRNINHLVSFTGGISHHQHYYRLDAKHYCRLFRTEKCIAGRKGIRERWGLYIT